MEHIFIGSGLCLIGEERKISLPPCIENVLILRKASNILVSRHENDPCLVVFDRAFARALASDLILLRQSDPLRYAGAMRRTFGCVEEVTVDNAGTMTIPPLMFSHSDIGETALVVGAGGTFELWNPATAIEFGDPGLRELAEFYRDQPTSEEG